MQWYDDEPDETQYRLLADRIIENLNPRDDDVAEVALLLDKIDEVTKYLERVPCTCAPDAGPPDWDVDVCPRCAALGRARNRRVEG